MCLQGTLRYAQIQYTAKSGALIIFFLLGGGKRGEEEEEEVVVKGDPTVFEKSFGTGEQLFHPDFSALQFTGVINTLTNLTRNVSV